MAEELYVHYGCGADAPTSWLNFDASPSVRLQRIPVLGWFVRSNYPRHVRYGNIVKGLPLPPNSCRGIYCSHVLEHLSLDDCRRAMRNTFSYLVPGGTFRLTLPDLEQMARDYLNSGDRRAAIHFIERTIMGRRQASRGIVRELRSALSASGRHLWNWDYNSLSAELEEIGFASVRRAEFNDGSDPRFKDVERKSRWSLGVEGTKPS
jgi:hypothetical protein